MSKDQLTIEQHESTIAGLREKVAELRGELLGEHRGEHRVAAQLAEDIRKGGMREEQHRRNAERAAQDVHRLLRLVAGHVLDVRQGTPPPDAVELLVEELAVNGFPLRHALLAVQVERAEATGRVSAAEAAHAVVSAP